MDRSSVRVSVRVFGAMVAAGRSMGVDVEPILAELGIDEGTLRDPDARLPLATEDALWERLAESSGDPCFGLHAATRIEPSDWDVVGYALRSSPTLRDAIRAAARYNRLTHDVARLEVHEDESEVRIVHRFAHETGKPCWHAADYTIATLVVVSRMLVGSDIVPTRIRIAHPAPDDTRCYRELFGQTTVIELGAREGEVVLPREVVERPVIGGDPALHAVLRRHADELLSKLPEADDLPTRVRGAITAALRGGDPSLAAVAKRLGTSGRTLQRRLDEHGVGYQELLEELRRELAFRYLGEEQMAIAEVAYLLGFSEPRAFHRAFKRWTGSSPAAWRDRADEER